MTDYTELVKALRCCIGDYECEKCPRYEQYEEGGGCIFKLNADAAAAIEALQAELERKRTADFFGCKCEKLEPKRGEWIRVQEVDIPGEMHPAAFKCMCSVCRNEYLFPKIPRYCPDCGSMNTAKMGVQDGSKD